MNYRYYVLETYLNATVDAITHVYCYVEYSVLTVILPQHCTCKTKHHFPTQLCRTHMNKNSSMKVYTIHMETKCFQPRIPYWHAATS